MRQKTKEVKNKYKILVVDDEQGVIDSLTVVLDRNGYNITGTVDPLEAVELVRKNSYDMLISDFLMSPIHGDEVVKLIREFDNDLYILLLTGHKDLAPPLETIRTLEIQGYCEKSDRFDQLILLVESGIKSINQMRTVKKLKDGLNKILLAVPKIYQLQPIGNILEDILSEILPLINGESAFIIIDDIFEGIDANPAEEKRTIFRGIGKYKYGINAFADETDPEILENIGKSRMTSQTIELSGGLILPLLDDSQNSIGVLYIEGENLDQDAELIKIYATQSASSLNNAFLHSLVNTKNEELRRTYNMLKSRYMDTIEALRLVVDAKDIYTRGHSDRVAFYCKKIGESFNLSDEDLEILRVGGLFHDVGKIGTADDVLLKTDKLTEREYEEIKKHPLKGAQILSAVSMFKEIVPLVKQHHERLDGSGYPEGLKGDEISFFSRIISISDAFDAMMSNRTYRSKLTLEQAKEQLRSGIGTQFDKEITEVFLMHLNNYPALMEELQNQGDDIIALPIQEI